MGVTHQRHAQKTRPGVPPNARPALSRADCSPVSNRRATTANPLLKDKSNEIPAPTKRANDSARRQGVLGDGALELSR